MKVLFLEIQQESLLRQGKAYWESLPASMFWHGMSVI